MKSTVSMASAGEKVTVVIPSLNEVSTIRDCVESLLNNDYPEELLEILIIDGKSNDGTINVVNDLCNDNPNVRLLVNDKKITPAALNIGVKNASGNYIMIASAHSLYPVDYIPELVCYLNNSDAAVAGGVMETLTREENKKSLAIKLVLSSRFGVGNSLFRIGTAGPESVDTVPFGMFRREVFQTVGHYDERLIRNHDIELSKRIIKSGLKIFLLPEPKCYYLARENYIALAGNNYKNGLWNMTTVYLTKSFKSLSIRHFIPLIFILALLVPLITAFFTSILISGISLIVLFLYFIFLLVNTAKTINRPGLFINLIWSYIVIHFSYGLGSLVGCLRIKYLLTGN